MEIDYRQIIIFIEYLYVIYRYIIRKNLQKIFKTKKGI